MIGRDRYIAWVFKHVRNNAMRADQAEAFLKGMSTLVAIAAAVTTPCMMVGITVLISALEGMNMDRFTIGLLVATNLTWIAGGWFILASIGALAHTAVHIERYGLAARQETTSAAEPDALSEAMGATQTPA